MSVLIVGAVRNRRIDRQDVHHFLLKKQLTIPGLQELPQPPVIKKKKYKEKRRLLKKFLYSMARNVPAVSSKRMTAQSPMFLS